MSIVDAVEGVISDAQQHEVQIRFGIGIVKLCRANGTVDGRCAFTTGVGVGEQVIAPSDSHPS